MEVEGPTQDDAPPPPPPKATKVKVSERGSIAHQMDQREDADLRDWLDSLAVDGEVKVGITRKRPLLGPHGENISGALETVDGRIDEDYIRETWGGGEFSLKIYVPRGPAGQWKYFRGRTVKIAGAPKMHGQALTNGSTAAVAVPMHADDGLAERAFQTMERNAERAQQRAERLEEQQRRTPPPGLDVDALRTLNQPFVAQMEAAQQTIAHLQQQLIAQANKAPPRDEFRDRLMERMIDGESSRIEALRAQYEGRIDKLKDNHEDQIKRLEDRHVDEIKRLESRHERELRLAEKTVDGQTKNLDVAFQARLEALKESNARLERELTAAGAKVATLEARKDQSIGDKADELIKIKEALDGIGGGDEKDQAWYEKLIGAVGNSEAAVNLINKISGGAPEQQQQQSFPPQQQLPPPGIPFTNGDGNVYVRDAQGNVVVVDQTAMRQQRALQAARKKKRSELEVAEASDQPGYTGRAPDAGEMKIAVSFMEAALRNGTTPEQFGATARNMVPSDILDYLHGVGIEQFLDGAKLESGSPLTTMRGRQFVRAVAKFLSGGGADGPEMDPPEAAG